MLYFLIFASNYGLKISECTLFKVKLYVKHVKIFCKMLIHFNAERFLYCVPFYLHYGYIKARQIKKKPIMHITTITNTT